MPPSTTVRRLSPKVRRLLREHDLEARSLPGSGAGGRVTPADVLAAAGVPRLTALGAVAASPAARRLLRDAGHDPGEAAAAMAEEAPLTTADVRRFLDEDRATSGTGPATGPDGVAGTRATVETAVDVGLLLAHLRAAEAATAARDGFEIPPLVAVASAIAGVLTARPATWTTADDGPAPAVSVALAWPDATAPVVVADAALLTVPGLARRAHTASVEVEGRRAGGTPTVLVAPEGSVTSAVLGTAAAIGVLTVDAAVPRRVEGTDELGHAVVTTRPHVTVRLRPGGRVTAADADAILGDLAAALVAWNRPVGL